MIVPARDGAGEGEGEGPLAVAQAAMFPAGSAVTAMYDGTRYAAKVAKVQLVGGRAPLFTVYWDDGTESHRTQELLQMRLLLEEEETEMVDPSAGAWEAHVHWALTLPPSPSFSFMQPILEYRRGAHRGTATIAAVLLRHRDRVVLVGGEAGGAGDDVSCVEVPQASARCPVPAPSPSYCNPRLLQS